MRSILVALVLGLTSAPCLFAQGNWGAFHGPLLVELIDTDHDVQLTADFSYTDPGGREWIAPKGFKSDGASVPRAFWSVVGGPLDGQYRKAAVIHDRGCVTHEQSWQATALVFYNAMMCAGVDVTTAKIMYFAVYHFGPTWDPTTGANLQFTPSGKRLNGFSHMDFDANSLSAHDADLLSTITSDPDSRRTQMTVEQVKEWVAQKNPSLEQIREISPETKAQK